MWTRSSDYVCRTNDQLPFCCQFIIKSIEHTIHCNDFYTETKSSSVMKCKTNMQPKWFQPFIFQIIHTFWIRTMLNFYQIFSININIVQNWNLEFVAKNIRYAPIPNKITQLKEWRPSHEYLITAKHEHYAL